MEITPPLCYLCNDFLFSLGKTVFTRVHAEMITPTDLAPKISQGRLVFCKTHFVAAVTTAENVSYIDLPKNYGCSFLLIELLKHIITIPIHEGCSIHSAIHQELFLRGANDLNPIYFGIDSTL